MACADGDANGGAHDDEGDDAGASEAEPAAARLVGPA